MLKQRAPGVVCEKHMNNYTFYLKHLRCFLLGSCILLFTSQAKAQAPDNIKGLSITVSVTDGADPLAETGKWIGLPSALNNGFALVPITSNISPTFGTYSYSKTSGAAARVKFYNAVRGYRATITMIFETQDMGTLRLSLDDDSSIFQEGIFRIKKGNAPDVIVGKKGVFTITGGDGAYGDYGVWEWIPKADGTYVVNSLSGDGADSNGTYNYVKVSSSTAKIAYNDSEVGTGSVMQMTFDSNSTGAVFLKGSDSEDYQTCTFKFESVGDGGDQGVTITKHPIPVTVAEGQPVQFKVEVDAAGQINYQWYKEGKIISQANSAVFKINLTKKSDEGTYQAILTSGNKTYESDTVKLTVLEPQIPPVITKQPQDLIIVLGEEATFSVNGKGTGPLDYQWYKDGKQVAGATSENYKIWEVSKNDFGSYSVSVKNKKGKAISQIAKLRRAFTPEIIQQPQSRYVLLGDTVDLNVKASGSDPLSYQWYREVLPVKGANRSNYQILNIKESELGSYSVKVKNFVGAASSQMAVLKQAEIPIIIIHPLSQHLDLGNKAVFVVKATGTKPLNYVWYKNGKPIDDSNSQLLTLNNITNEDETIYSVSVKNDFGKAVSKIATLAVKTDPPFIMEQPNDIEVDFGEYAEFSVIVEGNKPFDYQWYKNGKVIQETDKSTFVIPSVSESDISTYSVRIKNKFGKAISRIAVLKRAKLPEILKQPLSLNVNIGSEAIFTVEAKGSEPLDYLWYKNGKPIQDSNSPFLKLHNVTKEDETIYSVRAKNNYGKAISVIVSLTVITDPPTITVQPRDIEAGLGEYAEFSVAVKGNEPFDYQWYKNGKIIEGGNKATLAIPSVSGDDITIYSVRIKNQFGKAISRIAELKLKKPKITLTPPTVDATGRLVLIANGPPNRKVIFQFSNDLMKWNDQLTLPLSEGTTTFNVPIQSSPNAPNLFYRLKLVE
ncbi:immunoglobulin domain-containing protein [bacterium]|nr:immunoglobulin domain-containing protein [bacterium]